MKTRCVPKTTCKMEPYCHDVHDLPDGPDVRAGVRGRVPDVGLPVGVFDWKPNFFQKLCNFGKCCD